MLQIEGITAGYGKVPVIRDVFSRINEKEIVSIVGSNGAGKSTLLKVVSGIIKAQFGKIFFLGERIDGCSTWDIVKMGVVRIPEGRKIFPSLTVLENVQLGAYSPRGREKMNENQDFAFQLFPILSERKNQRAGTLSGGEQQMLALARGLMSSPRLIMLDEPSLGLAPKLVQRIFEAVKNINNQGIGILIVEQNVRESLKMSLRAYVLENGSIVLEGKGQELLNNEHVKKAYLGI
ncbi:MAG: ABC transporter ATP-binding protein [Candidatus Helarchaeota archaeon]|nr:ABC transporter ATP-binding protein [Candidatus Helarchaeota archaeon]